MSVLPAHVTNVSQVVELNQLNSCRAPEGCCGELVKQHSLAESGSVPVSTYCDRNMQTCTCICNGKAASDQGGWGPLSFATCAASPAMFMRLSHWL